MLPTAPEPKDGEAGCDDRGGAGATRRGEARDLGPQDAGGQIGWLQVACYTPARRRLNTETLENLSRVQRLLTRGFHLEH